MKIVKSLLLAAVLALTTTGCATTTSADTRVGVGIHLDLFPDLHPVPGYPVYYAPNVSANLFFYDGAYWLYGHNGWYVSDWYNGPWDYVEPDYVPWFVLRVPVRYYRAPPPYFRGWYYDAPPRWGHYWGPGWAHRHNGWDHWDRSYVPRRAPLPTYQRDYRGNRYPDYQRQRDLQKEHYRYRSQDPRYNKYRDDHRDSHKDGRRDDRYDKDRQRNDRPGNDRQGYDNRGNDRYRNENRGSEGRDRDRPTVYQTPQRDVKPRGPEGAQFERSRESGSGGLRMQDGRPNGYESRGFSQPQRERSSREQQRREQPAPEQSGREFNSRQDRGGWQQAPRQQQSPPPQQLQREYQQPRREYQQPQQRQRVQVESRGEGRQQIRNGELGGGRNQERGWPERER